MYRATIDQNENYLKHHGTKGQRWGVKHGPPYPLDEKSKAILKKEWKRDIDENEVERRKKDVAATADVEAMYNNIWRFDNNEIQAIIDRVNKESALKKLVPEEPKVKTGIDKFEDWANKANRYAEAGKKAGNAYNVAASVANAFLDTDLPKIDFNTSDKKDDKSKKSSKEEKLDLESKKLKNEDQQLKNDQTKYNQKKQKQKDREERNQKIQNDIREADAKREAKSAEGDAENNARLKEHWAKEEAKHAPKESPTLADTPIEKVSGEVVDDGHDWTSYNDWSTNRSSSDAGRDFVNNYFLMLEDKRK